MADKKTFTYKARLANGKFVEGSIKAENKELVAQSFVEKNIILLEIQEQSLFSKDVQIIPPRIKTKEVATMMRQLATMTDAGIPLVRCLDVIRDQTKNPTFKEVLIAIKTDIGAGLSLANAMARHPKAFSPLIVSMIRAGEAGGFLTPDVLIRIAQNLEADIKIKSKIKSALIYPGVVLSMILLIVTFLLIFVVPGFVENFERSGTELPVPTQILIAVSSIVRGPGLLVLAGIIAATVYFVRKNQWKPGYRRVWEPIKYKLPVFGKLFKKVVIARFARNFGALIDAGLPIIQVIDVVGSTSGSVIIEDALQEAKKYVGVGELISPQLRKHPIFPEILVEMLSVGEEAGEISKMLERIAETYDYEVESMADALTSLLEPVLVVILGIVVGGMLLALYLPMFMVYGMIE
jgi:type IV pilus assembly protein PilC